MKEKEQDLMDLFMEGLISRTQVENLLKTHRKKRKELQERLLLDSHTSSWQLTHQFRKTLSAQFGLILTRGLSETDYENLWKKAVKQVVIYSDFAIFMLVDGKEISIPRLHEKRWKFFPEWEIGDIPEYAGGQLFETGHSPIKITYYSGKKGLLHRDEHFIFLTE